MVQSQYRAPQFVQFRARFQAPKWGACTRPAQLHFRARRVPTSTAPCLESARKGRDRPDPAREAPIMATAPPQPTSSQQTSELLHRLAEKRSRLDSQRTETLRMMRDSWQASQDRRTTRRHRRRGNLAVAGRRRRPQLKNG